MAKLTIYQEIKFTALKIITEEKKKISSKKTLPSTKYLSSIFFILERNIFRLNRQCLPARQNCIDGLLKRSVLLSF